MHVQGRSTANDNKKHDHHAGNAAYQHVHARVLVLSRTDALLHEPRLKIEKLPWRNGRPHQSSQHQEIRSIQVQRRHHKFVRRIQPIRFRQECRQHVRKIKAASYEKYFFHDAIASVNHQQPDSRTAIAANGTETYRLTCITSEASATPENSATVLNRSTNNAATITKNVDRNPNSSRIRSERPLPVTTPMRAHISSLTYSAIVMGIKDHRSV